MSSPLDQPLAEVHEGFIVDPSIGCGSQRLERNSVDVVLLPSVAVSEDGKEDPESSRRGLDLGAAIRYLHGVGDLASGLGDGPFCQFQPSLGVELDRHSPSSQSGQVLGPDPSSGIGDEPTRERHCPFGDFSLVVGQALSESSHLVSEC